MSVNFIKLEKHHLLKINLQEHQSNTDFTDDNYVNALLNGGNSYAIIADNMVLGAVGFIEETQDRALMWALLSKDIKQYMISVHRKIKQGIDNSKYNRIYARVHTEFYNGIIWVKLLGLDFEGIEKQYMKGHDYAIFSKVKGA
jgi:hypothetical protein